jgi:hypothetical protein
MLDERTSPGSGGGGLVPQCQHGQLDSGVDVELEVHVLEVGVHGVRGEVQLLGDGTEGGSSLTAESTRTFGWVTSTSTSMQHVTGVELPSAETGI